MLQELILSAALALPAPWYETGRNPETPDEYEARVGVIAKAVAIETEYHKREGREGLYAPHGWRWGRKSLAAAVLAHLYSESRFAKEVHEGSVHPVWTQDDGQARCLAQLQATGLVSREEWLTVSGTDLESTRRCVALTVRVLATMQRYCVRTNDLSDTAALVAMFSGLSGSGCKPTVSGREKAALWGKIWRRIK
jgi:hypothetical protein